jgi:hypothetical protein
VNPIYAQTEVDFVGIVVSRQETESQDINPALNVLESLLFDAETVRMFQGQASISFQGYDSDSQELYQVQEIRRYVAQVDSKFPYWFYFLADADTLKFIAFCLCRTREIDPGMAYPDPHDMHVFMLTHFDAMNRLFDRFQLDESINKEISSVITNCFHPRGI